jgi:hypothetical protein
MIEHQGLEERQQKWKEAQASVIEKLVGKSSPPYDISSIRDYRGSGNWGNAVSHLWNGLQQKSLALQAINLGAQELAADFLKSIDGKSDQELLRYMGHPIPHFIRLCDASWSCNGNLCLEEEFKDGRVSPVTKGLLDLLVRFSEIYDPSVGVDRVYRLKGQYELAEKETMRIETFQLNDELRKEIREKYKLVRDTAGQEMIREIDKFRSDYSSQLITPEQLKQEVLGLVLSVERLWFPRGS